MVSDTEVNRAVRELQSIGLQELAELVVRLQAERNAAIKAMDMAGQELYAMTAERDRLREEGDAMFKAAQILSEDS